MWGDGRAGHVFAVAPRAIQVELLPALIDILRNRVVRRLMVGVSERRVGGCVALLSEVLPAPAEATCLALVSADGFGAAATGFGAAGFLVAGFDRDRFAGRIALLRRLLVSALTPVSRRRGV